MGLGAPLALLLLGALVLPWLAHRMRQRDVPTVRLPTIALLQQAMVVTQRRRALQDLLLMLARMALIATLVFGLAAPFVWDRVSVGNGEPQSLVIVIDDSMSMQRRQGGASLWSQAQAQALRAIEQLPATSQVAVIAAGRPPRMVAALDSPSLAQAALTRFSPSPARGTALPAAVELANAMLAAAQHAQRRVWVLSDFIGRGAALDAPDPNITLHTETFGSGTAEGNVAIVHAQTKRDADAQGQYRLFVQAQAFQGAAPDVTLRVRVADRVVHEQPLTFDGHSQASAEIALGAEDTAEHEAITVELVTGDVLAIDDRRDVLLRDERARRVLLVNGDPRPTHSSDELHFLSRALPLHDAGSIPLVVESMDALGLTHAALDDTDMVWLANVEAPTSATVARLRTFVENGGALVVSAGDRTEPPAFNARFDALLPARVESVETHSGIALATEAIPADPWGIAVADVGAAVATRRLLTHPRGHVALRFADGVPALIHHSVGRGRVALWTTSIDGDWTDLPYRPGYLALTLSLIDALTHAPNAVTLREPGERVPLSIPSGVVDATLIDPSGAERALPLGAREIFATPEQTQVPGAYLVRVTDDNGLSRTLGRSAFVVAPPVDESDLVPSPPPLASAPTSTTTRARVRRSFEHHVFAWLPALLLIEALLRAQRRRSSATNTPAHSSR